MLPNLNQPTRKWRRINPYICDKCGKPRYSFIFTRAKEKICRSCARNQVPENQQSLFDVAKDFASAGGIATNIKTDLDDLQNNAPKLTGDIGEPIMTDVKPITNKRGEVVGASGKKFLKKMTPKMTPLEAAKDLIRDEVFRGDSLSSLKSSQMGTANGRYWGEVMSGGRIVIKSLDKEELNPPVIFSLSKIYNEILMEKKQHEKCGCDRNKIVAGLNKQALGRSDLETKEIIDVAFPPLGRKKKK